MASTCPALLTTLFLWTFAVQKWAMGKIIEFQSGRTAAEDRGWNYNAWINITWVLVLNTAVYSTSHIRTNPWSGSVFCSGRDRKEKVSSLFPFVFLSVEIFVTKVSWLLWLFTCSPQQPWIVKCFYTEEYWQHQSSFGYTWSKMMIFIMLHPTALCSIALS